MAKERIPDHIKVQRLATKLDKSDRWVKDKIKEGEFQAHRFGHELAVTVDSVEGYLRRTRVTIEEIAADLQSTSTGAAAAP